MKRSIGLVIAAIGFGLTTNVFANASGTQVNPSTINLSADGVNTVGIHTQLTAGTDVSCVHIVDSKMTSHDVYASDLTIGSDSVGHLVVTIDSWATLVAPTIATGEAIFEIHGSTCGGDLLTDDTAKIINNSGKR